MKIQETEWGYVEWQHIHEENNPRQSMNIGRTVILPGKHQVEHVHYGQEQLVYILSGEGIYVIDGERKRCSQGAMLYMEAGSTHETINDTDEPICELLVSNPVSGAREISMREMKGMDSSGKNALYAAVESLRGPLIEPLNLPLTIFASDWQVVLQTPHFPAFCKKHCDPEKHPETCACMESCTFSEDTACIETVCPMNLRIYSVPIIHEDMCIGVVRGGFILLTGSRMEEHEGLYDMPESAALSIKKLLGEIANNIVNYCVFDDARRELETKENAIISSRKHGAMLEQNLQIAQDTVTNLKINHHFLFNTLNCMASMALQDGSERLYSGIIDLADLFRYTMKTDCRFVAFERELAYLNNYLNLQKLRYRKGLSMTYDLNDALMGVAVPFNFLQPIAENAFIHGFGRNVKERRLVLRAWVEDGRAHIIISNNGAVMNPITLNRVNRSLTSGSGHGLSLIYSKLAAAFGKDFTMTLLSGKEETSVAVNIPARAVKEEPHD